MGELFSRKTAFREQMSGLNNFRLTSSGKDTISRPLATATETLSRPKFLQCTDQLPANDATSVTDTLSNSKLFQHKIVSA